MATKKTTNITGADLISFIDGCAPNQTKVLDKSNLDAQSKEPIEISQPSKPSRPSRPAEKVTESPFVSAKRISQKQRKASLEEYKNSFLNPPKIIDRKTVYLSAETRDRLDEIVRRLGERGSSVSGFIENMAKEHLETYHDEIEQWKKL